jgi:hypothetical protein
MKPYLTQRVMLRPKKARKVPIDLTGQALSSRCGEFKSICHRTRYAEYAGDGSSSINAPLPAFLAVFLRTVLQQSAKTLLTLAAPSTAVQNDLHHGPPDAPITGLCDNQVTLRQCSRNLAQSSPSPPCSAPPPPLRQALSLPITRPPAPLTRVCGWESICSSLVRRP